MTDVKQFDETLIPSPFLAEYRGSFLANEGRTLDAVLRITLELAAELWAAKERSRMLEQQLIKAGVIAEDAIELSHVTPCTGAARRRRTEYVDTIFRHLLLQDVDDPLSVVSPEDIRTPMHGHFAEKVSRD
ncbi:hypothetical protein AB0H83_30360 [Dactylosporangium sp. NPDC050688]|uniref:hypothetical protein n=1 Tax=Dactylosporangium sp. NPDC050688 TaxID=3157217 RepID=UPI0033DA0942